MISALESQGFRNLSDGRVELAPGLTVFHGPNGSGKTNLLEAIYFGLTNRSFRSGTDRDMIAFAEQSARVELELSGEQGGELLSALERSGERRHRIDGRELGADPARHRTRSGGAGLIDRPLVSVFHPDRLQLVKGAAAHRRAHLDRLVGALWPARASLRSQYGRTLAQRNALVSRIKAGLAERGSLATWDARLAEQAVPLMASRAEGVELLREPFAELGGSLGLDRPEVAYRPRAAGSTAELEAELAERREDLGRAYTSYGPQLDEVEMRLAERPLRRFGSQGQQRAALLTLLFAERRALIDAGRPTPVMLLDDVMSELDPERRQLLVSSLEGSGQALLTATEPEHVPAVAGLRLIAVCEGGALEGTASARTASEETASLLQDADGRAAA